MCKNYARIAMNKAIVKEFQTNFGRTVYLNDGDEFQIELFNYENVDVAVTIEIDGQTLSNQLILRPGERVWLERYLDVARKFKFSTYEVEDGNSDVEKAISNNGLIKLSFYRQSKALRLVNDYTYYNFNPINKYYYDVEPSSTCLNCSCDVNYLSSLLSSDANESFYKQDCCTTVANSASLVASTKETGRTEQGSHSSQTFSNVNEEFAILSFRTETIKILPASQKPYTVNDLEKIYCSNCGRKLKTKYNFCPFCGKKID